MNRKGKMADRQPILSLFVVEQMSAIFIAADAASKQPPLEHHHLFLKKIAEVRILLSRADFSHRFIDLLFRTEM